MPHRLTIETADRFAAIALGHVAREYPHKLDHVMEGPEDVLSPRALHPLFFGSFDWHSCVHGYWLLMRTLRLFPAMPNAARIRALLDAMLVPEKVAGEVDYLDRAYTGGFERPYGWAWLLMLHAEAQRSEPGWAEALAPLAEAFAERFKAYLPKLTYPVRVGAHYNTAFAMLLALGWADANDTGLGGLIRARAADYYGGDRACPAWEPGGDEFLSPSLVEALLMRRTLPERAFRAWFAAFLPDLADGRPASLFTPAFVSDRSDGKIAHLDASLPYVAGDYMGEHWLATFALLALETS